RSGGGLGSARELSERLTGGCRLASAQVTPLRPPPGRGPGAAAAAYAALRRRTLRRTPARCHRDPALARGDGPTYTHEGRRPAVRLQQSLSLCGSVCTPH